MTIEAPESVRYSQVSCLVSGDDDAGEAAGVLNEGDGINLL